MSDTQRVISTDELRVVLLDLTCPLVAHAHPQFQLFFKIEGVDSFLEFENESLPLSDHFGIGVNSWELHAYTHGNGVGSCTLLGITMHPSYIERVLGGHRAESFRLRHSLRITPVLRNHLAQLAVLAGSPQLQLRNQAELDQVVTVLLELCAEPSNLTQRGGSQSRLTDRRIRRSIEYMIANLSERIDLDVVASECCLSRPHFFELFRLQTHMTPGQYWDVLRMDYAFRSLHQPERRISYIAADLGFAAQGNFTRFFRSRQGVSPDNYRKAIAVRR